MSDEELIRDQIHDEKHAAIKTIAQQYALLGRCRDVLGKITNGYVVVCLLNDIDEALKRPWKQPASDKQIDAITYELLEKLCPEGYEPEDLQKVRESVTKALKL